MTKNCPVCGDEEEDPKEEDPTGLIMVCFFAAIVLLGLFLIGFTFEYMHKKLCVENALNKDICFIK